MPNVTGWNNTAERTLYPFLDTCADELRGVFLDVHILVAQDLTGVFLKQIKIEGNVISGVFWGENINKSVGKFSLNFLGDSDSCQILTEDGVGCGVILFNRERLSAEAAVLTKTFVAPQSLVHPACLIPVSARAIRSIRFPSGVVRGKVALVEGDGISLVKLGESQIRIDSIGSTKLLEECCGEVQSPLLGINSATPDEFGNIALDLYPFSEPASPTDVIQTLRISTSPGTITISLAR